MDDLRHVVEDLDLARDDPPRPLRQQRAQLVAAGMEEDQLERGRRVLHRDPPGPPPGARRVVAGDRDLDGHRRRRRHLADRGPPAPVDAEWGSVKSRSRGFSIPAAASGARSSARCRRGRSGPRTAGTASRAVRLSAPPISAIQAASSITSTPRSVAFWAFDPAPGPAITRSVFALTDPRPWRRAPRPGPWLRPASSVPASR